MMLSGNDEGRNDRAVADVVLRNVCALQTRSIQRGGRIWPEPDTAGSLLCRRERRLRRCWTADMAAQRDLQQTDGSDRTLVEQKSCCWKSSEGIVYYRPLNLSRVRHLAPLVGKEGQHSLDHRCQRKRT